MLIRVFNKFNITICVCLFYFFTANYSAKADFFSICKINEKELKNVEYVLNYSNDKFINYEIENVKNKTFQHALYLLSFYKTGIIPDDVIDAIGIDSVKRVLQFKNCAINYILKNSNGDDNEIKNHFKDMKLEIDDFLFILKNKYFQADLYSKDILTYLLKRVFGEKTLSYDDMVILIKKFGKKNITDNLILNQIRLNLWNLNYNNATKLIKFINNQTIKHKAEKIKEFSLAINKKTERIVRTNKRKKQKKFIGLTKKQKQNICNTWLGYDEYVDLICIENNNRNIEYIRKILKNNLNPFFMPHVWLTHRVFFAREMINRDNLIDNEAYKIIVNGDNLYKDNFYTQKFLSGFISYLRGNYDDAIVFFNECAKKSFFSEYKAKAYYWLGISYRRFGEKNMANKAFNKAKKHIFTFYGQLGASEVDEDPKKNIENYILSFRDKPDILCNDINFVLGYLQQHRSSNSNSLSEVLFSYINKSTDKIKLFNAIKVLKDDFKSEVSKSFAFYALRLNVMLDEINFPIIEYTDDSLVNAVIKKESNFKRLIGSSGERGIMQIMPSTGKMLTKSMGLKYSVKRLFEDNEYNVSIGKYYLKNLLYSFDDNKVLALASYNAGRGNVEKWIAKNGDPRDMKTNEEVVRWIEKIPFVFTRTYIPQILGFEMVYDVIKKLNTN